MHSSLILLTTTLLAAAPGETPADAKALAPVTAAQAMSAPMPTEVAPTKPTLGQRLRNFFIPARSERPDARAELPDVPMLEPREVHTAMPAGKISPAAAAPAASPVIAAKAAAGPTTTVTALRPNFDLAEKELKQVGHETDYSWITGKLFPAAGTSSRWVLRYTAPYEEDRYGGAVLLSASPELASYREGDVICVHGKVHGTGRANANATYDVQSVNLIERAGH